MGIGDQIMATAQAREVARATGCKTWFGEYDKIWKYNPYIATKNEAAIPVRNCTGDRPYILNQTDQKVIFNPNYHAIPGELYLTDEEYAEADEALKGKKDFIFLQPEVKVMFSKGNKAWPRGHWNKLAGYLNDFKLLQMIPNESETELKLKKTKLVVTKTFRVAAAALTRCKLLITCDGGLHHAAAALGVPAVVIWTGFSHPQTLGYNNHLNLRYDDSPPCGMKVECRHCEDMARKLTPEMVYHSICDYLKIQSED